MSATAVNTAPAPPLKGSASKLVINPWLGIAGVFLGAGIATLNGRLLSVGLPDLRGAMGLGFDEASWLPTALNMAMMFSGFAFGRIISDTSWDVSPVNFIVVATIAGAFWIAFFTRLVWLRKRVYRGKGEGPGQRPVRGDTSEG